MRKKILSVLLALCMVLSLLPVAAFAAKLTDAQVADLKAKGYTDAQIEEIQKQIADYESDEIVLVFEDTVIDQAESRLVLVVGKCNVEVSAALETGIVVAPGAADAKVALKAGADVNAVVVLDKAEVVVEKDAKAANVTLAAAEAAATVQGTVDTVAVNEAAEKATVTVAEGAKVDTVNIDAAGVTAEIKADTEIVLGENAENVEVVAAEDVNVAVSGNSDALTESSNVGDKADDEKKDETTEEPAPVDPGTGPENPGESEKPTDPVEPVEPPKGDTSGIADANKDANVTVGADGKVTVVADKDAETIAISIPVKNAEEGKTYKAYVITTVDGKTNTLTELNKGTAVFDDTTDYLTITFTEPGTYSIVVATEEEVTAINAAAAALDKAIIDQAAAQSTADTKAEAVETAEGKVTEAKEALVAAQTVAGKAADLEKALAELEELKKDTEGNATAITAKEAEITGLKTALKISDVSDDELTAKIEELKDTSEAEQAVTTAGEGLESAKSDKSDADDALAGAKSDVNDATTTYNTEIGKTESYVIEASKATEPDPTIPDDTEKGDDNNGGDGNGDPDPAANPEVN